MYDFNPMVWFIHLRGKGDPVKLARATGCLYNQETDEHPQLYFSHEFKTGDPYALAAEIRKGLDRMNSR